MDKGLVGSVRTLVTETSGDELVVNEHDDTIICQRVKSPSAVHTLAMAEITRQGWTLVKASYDVKANSYNFAFNRSPRPVVEPRFPC